ncbi:hypothetical protein LAG90_11555 [Marinilongibacter aquaticus]|uniref:ribonuclease domain-containing protein n=1 Tax=Marinilongibacter aquaticus TaxID=2975157 RepID=UPI0021BDA2C9|nr:ribonuclease domain-containing protein [Marinilongibacter aquaticus]UBM57454.1 hypothetical protein LAG90_11555 [Marinilongibacter aquaticus]
MKRLLLLFVACLSLLACRHAENDTILQSNAGTPQAALETLEYIQIHHQAPKGYVGGRKFGNYEQLLPKKTPSGEGIQYQEWDIYPKIKGKNRGAERLVTGSDKSAYYTPDHYAHFIPIKTLLH